MKIYILLLMFVCIDTYAQKSCKETVAHFYNMLVQLSNYREFTDLEVLNFECSLNNCLEGAGDCENKSMVQFPREFNPSTINVPMTFGPYIRDFEEFIANGGKVTCMHPKRIKTPKDSRYERFVMKKKYVYPDSTIRVLNDTAYVKKSIKKISGIRNELGGSRQVIY